MCSPGTKRELLVWIWYPSAAEQSVAMDDYLPVQMQAAAKPNGGLLRLLTRDLAKVHGHSSRDSDVSPQPRSDSRFLRDEASTDCTVGENSASQYSFGGIVSGLNGSFHEALPVCDVLAGKKHVAELLLEGVPHGEPLAGTIESVRASSKWIRLPGLLLHR